VRLLETADRTRKYWTLDFTTGIATAANMIPTAMVIMSSRKENPAAFA
jgi:hypothetical protein